MSELTTKHLESVSEYLIRYHPALINEKWILGAYSRQFRSLDIGDRSRALVEAGNMPGFTPTPIFNPGWYSKTSGLASSRIGNAIWLLYHYLRVGSKEGLSPNPFFPSLRYSRYNPDVGTMTSEGGTSLLLDHFILKGYDEGRHSSLDFDSGHYLRCSGLDPQAIEQAGLDSFTHYVVGGYRQGWPPNAFFDEEWYVSTNGLQGDLGEAGTFVNGFSHYLHVGEEMGLAPSSFLDAQEYASLNSDVADAVKGGRIPSAMSHLIANGLRERRAISRDRVSSLVTRFFPSEIPNGRMIVTPTAVNVHAKPMWMDRGIALRPGVQVAANQLFEVAQIHEQQCTPLPAELCLLMRSYIRDRAEPDIRVFPTDLPELYPSESATAHIVGIACLPLGRLVAVRAECAHLQISTELLRLPHSQYFADWAGPDFAEMDVLVGFYCRLAIECNAPVQGDLDVSLSFEFECSGASLEFVGPKITLSVRSSPQKSDVSVPMQVCMATYNPQDEALQNQIESILSQKADRIHLHVSDDNSDAMPRRSLRAAAAGNSQVHVSFGERNVGFVGNFERAARMVSDKAKYVCLADQDDYWYPEKIRALQDGFSKRSVTCCYSDMRIVRPDATVISETFWTNRTNHHSSPSCLALANTITGAASMFRADIIRQAVPFPRFVGLFHDQWLSIVASALGDVRYINEPLYDYIQHGKNVLGFNGSRGGEAGYWRRLWRVLNKIRRVGSAHWSERETAYFIAALEQCQIALMQRAILLGEALRRFPKWHDEESQLLATGFCDLVLRAGESTDLLKLARSFGRRKRESGGDVALLGNDFLIKSAICALQMVRSNPTVVSQRVIDHLATQRRGREDLVRYHADSHISEFERKIRGLSVSNGGEGSIVRINILMPELTLSTFFGGYYSKMALAQQLHAAGVAVRLILLDQECVDYREVLKIVDAFPLIADALQRVELMAVGARNREILFHGKDIILATTWWSAHVANQLRETLGQNEFLYLIQEYEPFTFPLGTWYRGAEETYSYPHRAIFSTEFLAEYFRKNGIGVFADPNPNDGERRNFLTFRNPITAVSAPRKAFGGARSRLLFYARPQPHASRNMYEYGLAALRFLVEREPELCEKWEFVGIGASEPGFVELGKEHQLKMLAKMDPAEYSSLLGTAQVGLVLMYTPHPSLVPLEMAAAGLLTVTNSCMTKETASFRKISPNIHVAEPTVASITQALTKAMRATSKRRLRRSKIDWPTTPEEAFPSNWISEFVTMGKLTMRPRLNRRRVAKRQRVDSGETG
jgi:glycosyltransferase involved in cell wall biosynthesis